MAMKQHFIFPTRSGFYIHLVQNLQIIRQLSICIFFAINCKFPEQDHFWLPITLPNRYRILRVHIFWVRIPLCIKLESDYSRSTFESKWVQSCKSAMISGIPSALYSSQVSRSLLGDFHVWNPDINAWPRVFLQKYPFAILGHCSRFSFYIKRKICLNFKFFTLFCW